MTTPVNDAIAAGALAAVGGGFNMLAYHHTGVEDQPLHALVVDGEIWTTGVGAGGYGLLIGDDFVTTRLNRIQVTVWRPDHSAFEVERVNRGHDGAVVAFTHRGGTNEGARRGRYYVSLGKTVESVTEGDAESRTMIVMQTSDLPLKAWRNTTVLESIEPLGLSVGDQVHWVQRLGAAGVHTIVSGWPEIIHDGQNVVSSLELHGEASHGPDNWFILRNPRMVIGGSSDGGTAYLVAVEGRLPNSYRPDADPSKGLRLMEMATFLIHQGVSWAVNFDGGGSAWQWIRKLGLVSGGCYNKTNPLDVSGLRPDHVCMAVI